MYPGGYTCELVFRNNPRLPENWRGVCVKCVCFPEEECPISFGTLKGPNCRIQ